MRLEAMFQKLEQAGLKLKPSKCKLFCKQITYMGHIISAQGIVTDEEKMNAINKWPTLTTVTKVCSFHGFMGYYCWLISNFMQIAWPLHKLTSSKNVGKKRAAITWNNRYQWSFNKLKCLCTTASFWPMMTLPSMSSCTLMLAGLAWGLFSSRPMTTGLMPSSPMPAGVWPRLRPITEPTNWSFLLLSGLLLRSSISTPMGWPLTFILTTIPWPTFKLQQSWMLWVIAG